MRKNRSRGVVTRDGLVATRAHHFALPGSKVEVALPDGRDLAGEVVGLSFPADIGLVRITEKGPFPCAEIGNSTHLIPGDRCFHVGYGPVDPQERWPEVRASASPHGSQAGFSSCPLPLHGA